MEGCRKTCFYKEINDREYINAVKKKKKQSHVYMLLLALCTFLRHLTSIVVDAEECTRTRLRILHADNEIELEIGICN